MDGLTKKLADLDDVTAIQCTEANWDYDPYMQGLANGLLLAQAIMAGKDPEYKNPPKAWKGRTTWQNALRRAYRSCLRFGGA